MHCCDKDEINHTYRNILCDIIIIILMQFKRRKYNQYES